MIITYEMLITRLNHYFSVFEAAEAEQGRILAEYYGEAGHEIRHVRTLDLAAKSLTTLHSDTLYILSNEVYESVRSLVREGNLEKDGPLNLLIRTESDWLLPTGGRDCLAFCESILTVQRLTEAIQEELQHLLRWDADFSAGILAQISAESLFSMGRQILDHDYALVDIDMNLVYGTAGYMRSRGVKEGRLPDEVFQDLVSRKKFHEMAERTESFYYYTDSVGTYSLCRNIFVNGQYISRLLLNLEPGQEKLPFGTEQMFDLFADRVQDSYTHLNLLPEFSSRHRIRALCRSLLSGEQTDQSITSQILESCGWADNHHFLCAVLRFSIGAGWDAQLLTTLPYLAASLERLWTGAGACAMPIEDEIYLILDLDVSGESYTGHSLWQKLAYFIRDNLCKAGVSPQFTHFSWLGAAGHAAAAALRMGSDRRPDLWYYLFDDYRLEYCLEQVHQELPEEMICHPAIRILHDHDTAHGTSLVETLQAYLDCNLNHTAASEKLFIHRTSFFRRMNQIRRLTRLDLDNPDTVFLLQLSFRVKVRGES